MGSETNKDVEKALRYDRRGSPNTDGEASTNDDSDGPLPQIFSSYVNSHGDSDSGKPPLDLDDPFSWISSVEGKFLIRKIQHWSFLERQGKGDNESDDRVGKSSYKINLAELQRLQLQELQYKLIGHVRRMHIGEGEKGDWRDDLRQYVQALQNHEYMEKCGSSSRDPFLVTGERRICRIGLNAAEDAGLHDNEMSFERVYTWEEAKSYLPITSTRSINRFRQFINRVVVATVGGGFLIGPMWLMVLHNTRDTALISTTAFVVVFGLMMACILDRYMDILSSTAAYAAVLVVFVGLTVQPSP
ncbi:hypothetical protein Hte_004412 [Hypoxylon texense]